MENELFTLLKQDHEEARHLMEEILSGSADRRQDLFIDLSDAVQLHMRLEEKFFYPRIEGHKVLKPAQKDALRDHQEARDLFRRLDRMEVRDRDWENDFRLLQQGLLKHMQIEEGYVFEKCLDILGESQLQEIAQKCRDEKQAEKQAGRQGRGTGRETRV